MYNEIDPMDQEQKVRIKKMNKMFRVVVSAALPHAEFCEEVYHVGAEWSYQAILEAMHDFNFNMMIEQGIRDYEILNVSAREEQECDEE